MNKLNFRLSVLVTFILHFGLMSSLYAQIVPLHLNILEFGAVQDSSVTSTNAIQTAINRCYLHGGGTVYIPAGKYLTGTVILKDNVTLYVDSGATLFASRNIQDYIAPLKDATRPVLIYSNGAKNVSIKGKGIIHGQAKRTYEDLRRIDPYITEITEHARAAGVEMKRYYPVKPDVSMIIFYDCQNIRIEDISLIESSFWTLQFVLCSDVNINRVKIESSLEQGVNSDGIDVNSSRNFHISNCIIRTGDDAIAIKTRYPDPCENILVENCKLSSSSTALKIGTESYGDFRHITFQNCEVENSNRGLSIVVLDGGIVEDVVFSDINIECKRRHFNWWGNGDPIWVNIGNRYPNSEIGTIRNIRFENIVASGMGTSSIESEEFSTISNIKLANVKLSMIAESEADKRANHAFFIKNADSLELNNFSVDWNDGQPQSTWKNTIFAINVDHLIIRDFESTPNGNRSNSPIIYLDNTTDVRIENATLTAAEKTFISIEGRNSHNIQLKSIDPLKMSQTPLILSDKISNPSSIQIQDER